MIVAWCIDAMPGLHNTRSGAGISSFHTLVSGCGLIMQTQIVAYYRVSTARQAGSGLGIEAQKAAVAGYATASGGVIGEEFTEVESGRCTERPVLAKAIAACRARRAVLVVAKLDRLSRDSHEISGLMKQVDFRCADMPNADPFQLHIFAALAEQEARAISARTKAALAAAKARGVKLGNPHLQPGSSETAKVAREALQASAQAKASRVLPYVEAARKAGAVTLKEIADALTARGVATPSRRGASWHPAMVTRVITSTAALSGAADRMQTTLRGTAPLAAFTREKVQTA